MTSAPILPGAVLGMLGGGQLGRMFALAARRMGYRVHVFAPEADTPAGQVSDRVTQAPYDDLDAVERFARSVDVVTYEFENVLAETVRAASRHAPVRPGGDLLHAAQNRIREKRALQKLGLPVAPFGVVESEADLATAGDVVPGKGVLKTASWGYDGKGQRVIEGAHQLEAAWRDLGAGPAVLEAFMPFEREVSVVGARGLGGDVALFDTFENAHANHILDVTLSPARISAGARKNAEEMARTVLEGLDVIGVLCVELFVLPGEELLVNEVAPRPHNSGHLTIDACFTGQFEQQVRAVCGLPLGDPGLMTPAAVMANLLGDLWSEGVPDWTACLAEEGVRLHLYGKEEARPGRKMGHLNLAGADLAGLEARVRAARDRLRPGSR